VVALAGGASVKTTVRTKPGDDLIKVIGDADVDKSLGGQFGGFHTLVLPLDNVEDGDDLFDEGEVQELLEDFRWAKPRKDGTARQQVQCPASGQGVMASFYRFDRLGRRAGNALGIDGPGSGTTVVVTEFSPFMCGTPAPTGPFAALGCVNIGPRHSAFGDDPSYVVANGIVYMVDMSTTTPVFVEVGLAGMNGGLPVMTEMQLIEVELPPLNGHGPSGQAEPETLAAWYFETAGGIQSFGPKKVESFEVGGDGIAPIDLRSDVRQVIGKALEVGPEETTVGDCPNLSDPPTPQELADAAQAILIYASDGESGPNWRHSAP